MNDSSGDKQPAAAGGARWPKKWLPCSLALLFGDAPAAPQLAERRPRRQFDEEARLMELLAAEHSDEPPDDGELEGSGDDYDG